MKTLISILLLSVVAGHAQWNKKIKGNQDVISEIRQTADYDEVRLVSFFDVILINGKEGNITLEGESNLLPHINTEVRNGKLTIDVKKNASLQTSRNKNITITVPIEDISRVSLIGSGDIESNFTIKAKNIALDLVGSGDIDLSLDSETVTTDIVGSGDIDLSGNCISLKSKITGSGDLNTEKLRSENVTINVIGSGDASVYCSERLKATVFGSGEVQYSGDPLHIEIKSHAKSKVVKKSVTKS